MPKRKKNKLLSKKQAIQKVYDSTKPTKESTAKEKLTWKFRRVLKHCKKNIDILKSQKKITADILKNKCKITYLFDAINQIALAKNIVIDRIPTPFGDCEYKKLNGDNYLATIPGVARGATSYRNLLHIITNSEHKEKYQKAINDFTNLKVPDDFSVDATKKTKLHQQLYYISKKNVTPANFDDGKTKFEDKSNFLKKKYNITYNQAAIILCGMFALSETMRFSGSGKMVRSLTSTKLSKRVDKKFPLAKSNGNIKTMNLLANHEFSGDSEIAKSLESNAETLSSESTLLEQESPEKKSPKKPKYSMKDITPSPRKHLKETKEKPTIESKKKQRTKEMKEEKKPMKRKGKK